MPASQPSGRRRDLSPRREYLLGMMQGLWPAPATVTRIGRFSRRSRTATDFIVLRSLDQPTLVLPRRPLRATAAAVRNYKSSAAGRTRLLLRLLAGAVRLGGAELLPDRIRVDPHGAEGVDAYLARVLDRKVLVSLYIGPTRAVQKPVLQLLTPDGETFAFAKVAINSLTRDLVTSETESLKLLNGVAWQRLEVPELLHAGELHGDAILVQRALAGSGSEVPPTALSEAMVELAQCQGTHEGPLADTAWWTGLLPRLDRLEPSPLSSAVRAAIEELEPRAHQVTVRVGSWHGDWAPWNMTSAGDRVLVWDWEQFEYGVPVGFDAVHFAAHSAVVMGTAMPAEALESARLAAPSLLAPFGVPADVAPLIVLLYVLELATGYLQDGEVGAGSKFGRLDLWLGEVLRTHLGHLQTGVRA